MGKPTASQRLGRWGEALAADYLSRLGYQILECNARTRYGEIDLVARAPDRATIVFIEVKTRRSASLGLPEISVTARKRAHLLAAIQAYCQEHPEAGENCRLDVIAIQRLPDQPEPQILHFENAVIGE
jgi:putative endonuclease